MIYRLRPDTSSFINLEEEKPFEVHFISFETEEDFNAFLKDKTRQKFMYLKEKSIRESLLIKGNKY